MTGKKNEFTILVFYALRFQLVELDSLFESKLTGKVICHLFVKEYGDQWFHSHFYFRRGKAHFYKQQLHRIMWWTQLTRRLLPTISHGLSQITCFASTSANIVHSLTTVAILFQNKLISSDVDSVCVCSLIDDKKTNQNVWTTKRIPTYR